jgi:hypothetical protein
MFSMMASAVGSNLEIDYGSTDRNSFSVSGRSRNVERVQSLNVQSEHMAILRIERYGLSLNRGEYLSVL